MVIIPIEIVNIILDYVGDLNNAIVITQYHLITNKEYYKINFNSEMLWKLKATLIMKRQYPSCFNDNTCFTKEYIALYKFGVPHYVKQLKVNEHYINKSVMSIFRPFLS
jgi:hypothetical protein